MVSFVISKYSPGSTPIPAAQADRHPGYQSRFLQTHRSIAAVHQEKARRWEKEKKTHGSPVRSSQPTKAWGKWSRLTTHAEQPEIDPLEFPEIGHSIASTSLPIQTPLASRVLALETSNLGGRATISPSCVC